MEIVPLERIEKSIYLIRGQKVMLDRDLAELYGVKTFVLNQAVKRKRDRFPEDFMFHLTRAEILDLSQLVISPTIKHAPNVNVFTEQGVAMLSGVLNSSRAVQSNIQIMRAFVRLRALQESQKQLLTQVNKHEIKLLKHDRQFEEVFQTLDNMRTASEPRKKKKIGFMAGK
jgi:hypothetical protein